MGLRRLRSGNARLVLGTSAVWVLIFLTTKDLWCSPPSLPVDEAAVGNQPARKTLFENIGEGFENVQRGEYFKIFARFGPNTDFPTFQPNALAFFAATHTKNSLTGILR